MSITNILELLSGLGFFLFGMDYMGDGLELAAGAKMKKLLEVLTKNPVMGCIVGLVVTAVIQSSSATTVMVMGFINAGMMTLQQAIGVIIGANIGTTVTSIIIALDVSAIAPVCIFGGAMMVLFCKKPKIKHIGQIVLGFGILFQGLHAMSASMVSLRTYPPFINFIQTANNPFIGVLVGTILCAILQSSSASVGVLQALALQGLMPADFAVYLVCGVNIGSASPPLLSALNAKTNAKRAAFVYLIYNVAGAILFVPIGILTPFAATIEHYIAAPVAQVAAIHIIFKFVTALVCLPFTNAITELSIKAIPDREHSSDLRFFYIDPNFVEPTPSTSLQIQSEIVRMTDYARESLEIAGNSFMECNPKNFEKVKENEELVTWLRKNIAEFFIKVSSFELSEKDSEMISKDFYILNDITRISEHAVNVMEKADEANKKGILFSENAQNDIKMILDRDLHLIDSAKEAFKTHELTEEEFMKLSDIEEEVNDLTILAQDHHLVRLKDGQCTVTSGMIYIKALTDFERAGDYAIHIASSIRDKKNLSANN